MAIRLGRIIERNPQSRFNNNSHLVLNEMVNQVCSINSERVELQQSVAAEYKFHLLL